MTNTRMRTVTEFRNVSYTERPRVIGMLRNRGFSIDEIMVIRVSACKYDIVAIKND